MYIKNCIKRNFTTLLLLMAFAGGFLLVGALIEGYGTYKQLTNIIQLAGFLGIVSVGQTVVILTGNFDLSCGAMISLNGIFFALMYKEVGVDWVALIFLTILLGLLLGAFNGAGVCFLKIPPLVMTLASGNIYKGIALVITKGTSTFAEINALNWFVNEKWILGFNGVVLLWALFSVATIFLLGNTTFGKAVYYTGSNPLAAHYSGISTKRTSIIAYCISGICCAVVGILLVGFTGKSYFGMGESYQFLSVAAVVVGGTSISGGKGSYGGTIAGTLLIILIQSVLTLFKIPYGGQVAIQGGIILLLVILYSIDYKRDNIKKLTN